MSCSVQDIAGEERILCTELDRAQDAAGIPAPTPEEARVAQELPALRARASALLLHSLTPAQRALYDALRPATTR